MEVKKRRNDHHPQPFSREREKGARSCVARYGATTEVNVAAHEPAGFQIGRSLGSSPPTRLQASGVARAQAPCAGREGVASR